MLANEQTTTEHGKAAALQELRDSGFSVPEFAVIRADDEGALEVTVAGIVARLGFPLAVRSSASAEDGAAFSYAGQFASYLNLNDADRVKDAVNLCRASLHSPEVEEYCRNSGQAASELRMDVIIQRLIEPQLSGVAFTINPVTGLEEVVIEASAGLGEDLLAGRQSSLPNDSALLRQYRTKIIEAVNAIAEHFGCPQDIEFAVENDVVWILQSRPITRVTTNGIAGEWTNANFREGGVSTSVCSPLMWSLYNLIWDSSLKDSLREIRLFSVDFEAGRFFFGRPYWNLGALKQCLARVPGFVEREFDTDLGIEINYNGDGIRTPVTPLTLLKFLPTVSSIRKFLKQQTAATTELLHGGCEEIYRKHKEIPDDAASAFRTLVEQDYVHFETNYFRTIFALSLAKMDFKHFFPQVNFPALMSDLPDVRHTAPMRRIRQMQQQNEIDVTALQSEFGYHYHVGLDIFHPRWDEDADYVESLANTVTRQRRSSPGNYDQTVAQALSTLSAWQRPLFRSKLTRLRRLVWLREEMRDFSNRMYHLLRKYILKIGEDRNLGDDIFFMTHPEIFVDDRSAISGRRATYNRFRKFTPPNELGRSAQSIPPVVNESEKTFRGLSACPGTVSGTARVVRTAQEAVQLPRGSILVCPHTDPGWTPALSRAAAVITEAGGMLSHAAVICREFALPAILSVPNACTQIPDGSSVWLDGGEGVIRVLS